MAKNDSSVVVFECRFVDREKILNREYRGIASDERYLVTTCLFQLLLTLVFLYYKLILIEPTEPSSGSARFDGNGS
jgi:hypothetical protein